MNFEQAAERVKKLSTTPSDTIMLQLYGLYKQATVGDVNTERPSFWDLVGKAKWDSWEACKGKTTHDAKNLYILFVQKLVDEDEQN